MTDSSTSLTPDKFWARYVRLPMRLLIVLLYIVLSLPLIIFFRLTVKFVPLSSRLRLGRYWNWIAARLVLRIRVQRLGSPCRISQTPAFIASNHVSWLDIPVLFSCIPTCFVARDAVQTMPIAGWLAITAGTIFIRRGEGEANHVAAQIGQRLGAGHNVVAFPEALATSGKSVNRFFPRLFAAPIESGALVQPVALRFLGDDDGTNPGVFFRAPMPMWPSLRSVLMARRTDVLVHFLPPIQSTGMERRALALAAYEAVHAQIQHWNTEVGATPEQA